MVLISLKVEVTMTFPPTFNLHKRKKRRLVIMGGSHSVIIFYSPTDHGFYV